MEQRIPHKDVTIGAHVFRLRKMDARTGTWLYSLLTAKASPSGEPVTLQQLINAFHLCTKDEFTLIQSEALKRISVIEDREGKEFELVILSPTGSGAFSFDFLNEEVTTVFQLTDLQVVFNVTPFFQDSASTSEPPNLQAGIR
jgi:hypothetical protein